jgi:hypothetical protein
MWRLAPLLLIAGALLACETEPELKSNDIVFAIPWTTPESNLYRVLDDEDEEVGTMELKIEEEPSGGLLFTQYFDFPDRGFVNEALVIADDAELQPMTSAFRIVGPEGNLQCEAEYEGSQVVIHRVGEDGERTDELDVPQVAYDSWTDLFLWRTVEFVEGREYEYADILSCTVARSQRLAQKLSVQATEEIEVPAGTFEVWKMEIEGGERDQQAWFSTDEDHRLVKYDNGEQTFELIED